MLGVSIELLDPAMLALALAALVPVGAGAVAVARSRRATRALGLTPSPLGRALVPLVAGGLAVTAGAAAAAQPVLHTTEGRRQRTSSEVVFVVDVSRSMLAAAGPEGPTRLDRARDVVRSLRAAVDDVPAGLSGLTDRVLPYAFPTGDERTFDRTLERSVTDEAPPPQQANVVATTFEPMAAVGRDGFFSPGTRFRTCVLVTDGEARSGEDASDGGGGGLPPSLPSLAPAPSGAGSGAEPAPDPAASGAALAGSSGCRLVAVRVGSDSDRIYGGSGGVEPEYRPDSAAASKLERFAEAAGGSVFDEGDLAGASRALRAAARQGPVENAVRQESRRALAPYLAALAALLAIASALPRIVRKDLRMQVSTQ
jgi:hypothetical protein